MQKGDNLFHMVTNISRSRIKVGSTYIPSRVHSAHNMKIKRKYGKDKIIIRNQSFRKFSMKGLQRELSLP